MGRRGPVQGRASITDIYNETTMTRIHTIARTGFIAALLALSAPLFAAEGWTTLFNGRDLTGWTTWVSMQPTSDNMKAPTSVRGANHDPKHVFSVVDGMLRVSGEEWGAVSTVGDYENFHLKFDVKWGEKNGSRASQRRATAACCTTPSARTGRRAGTGCAATSSRSRRVIAAITTASMA